MLSEIIQKNGFNILKTGGILILSTLANQALRETTDKTMKEMVKDVRKVKTDIKDRKSKLEEPIS